MVDYETPHRLERETSASEDGPRRWVDREIPHRLKKGEGVALGSVPARTLDPKEVDCEISHRLRDERVEDVGPRRSVDN